MFAVLVGWVKWPGEFLVNFPVKFERGSRPEFLVNGSEGSERSPKYTPGTRNFDLSSSGSCFSPW